MESSCSKQRNAVIKLLIFHQRIDPPHGIRCTNNPILGADDDIKPMAGIHQPPLLDQSGDGGGQGFGFQIELCQRLFSREVSATVDKLIVDELFKGSHAQIISTNRRNDNVFVYDLGIRVRAESFMTSTGKSLLNSEKMN